MADDKNKVEYVEVDLPRSLNIREADGSRHSYGPGTAVKVRADHARIQGLKPLPVKTDERGDPAEGTGARSAASGFVGGGEHHFSAGHVPETDGGEDTDNETLAEGYDDTGVRDSFPPNTAVHPLAAEEVEQEERTDESERDAGALNFRHTTVAPETHRAAEEANARLAAERERLAGGTGAADAAGAAGARKSPTSKSELAKTDKEVLEHAAERNGVTVKGTGKDGNVTKEDLVEALYKRGVVLDD